MKIIPIIDSLKRFKRDLGRQAEILFFIEDEDGNSYAIQKVSAMNYRGEAVHVAVLIKKMKGGQKCLNS